MKSRFHEAAEVELTEAVEYYDSATEGLGTRLLAEVLSAVEYIEEFPEIAEVGEHNVRRKVLARFPYSILYIIQQSELIILAIAHQTAPQLLDRSHASFRTRWINRSTSWSLHAKSPIGPTPARTSDPCASPHVLAATPRRSLP
jgi:plasmid stabilization system protein ParE